MSSQRQRLEDAIIDRLVTCYGKPLGGYLQVVEPYNGEIDQTDGPQDFIRALRGRSPGILVAAGGATYAPQSVSINRWRRSISIELLVSSNQNHTRESRHRKDVVARADPTADPGIYKILEDIFDALAGDCFGLEGIGRLAPMREDVLLQEDCFTAWRVTYESMTDAVGAKRDAAAAQLESLQINGNLVDTDGETVLPEPPNPFVEADTDPLDP